MGMMTVLMQLRKVCNHPDLFEPRSVVTPFTLTRICLSVPRCIIVITMKEGALTMVSSSLIRRMWCGREGSPGVQSALRHDHFVSGDLRKLEDYRLGAVIGVCPEVVSIFKDVCRNQSLKSTGKKKLLDATSSSRCRTKPFVFNRNVLELFHGCEGSTSQKEFKSNHPHPHPLGSFVRDIF